VASPYVQLLRTPRAWPFSLAGFFARLPLSMGGLAMLLLMVDITDSYFIAGAVDATWILVGAIAAPAIAMLIDRYGQRRVIGPQICVWGLAIGTILVLAAVDAPVWTFFVAAAVSGAALPIVGAVVRARWTYVLATDPALMRTAYSWESVVDECVFVVGPPLAASVAAWFGGATALGLTAIVGILGTIALLAQRHTEPPPKPPDSGKGRVALRYRGMPAVVVVMFALGVLFAGVEVTVIATARETDKTAVAGVVLGLWSIASLIAGLIVGGLKRMPGLHIQLLAGSAATWLLLLPLLFVHSLAGIGAVLLFAGAGVSPALIAGFALASRLVPGSALTQSLTWTSIAIGAGFALGSPASGWLVDHIAIEAGFWVALTAGLVATGCALISQRSLAHEYAELGDSPDGDRAV
jgi:MFS family permease